MWPATRLALSLTIERPAMSDSDTTLLPTSPETLLARLEELGIVD